MKVSVFTNAIPVVTIIFAVSMGQETLTWPKAAGILIVVGGLVLSQSVLGKKERYENKCRFGADELRQG